jgi:hypothetical protein
MTDTYPRLSYSERLPSTIPNLWDGGWENEAAAKVYFESFASDFDITPVLNLDAIFEAKVGRADYLVRCGDPRGPTILEVKTDLRRFLHAIGPDGSQLFDGIRDDERAYQSSSISWPSVVFAGTDMSNHRGRLERQYPGEVIVTDEDAPHDVPTFSEFQQSLKRAFQIHAPE